MLQHCPTDVTGWVGLWLPVKNGADGRANDSQNPRQALVVMANSTQSGMLIFRVLPE
jgi:hypothetical protein